MTAQARVSWYTFYSLNFRLTLARLESGPMFCLLLMPITIESFRVVVKELQFLLVSAAISLATYLLNATMARCQKEFVKDERRAREAGWDDVRFVACRALPGVGGACYGPSDDGVLCISAAQLAQGGAKTAPCDFRLS